MKLLVGFFVFFTLLFLFGGLLLVGAFNTSSSGEKQLNTTVTSQATYPDAIGNKLSMKQIDSISSVYNYHFTSANAVRVPVYSPAQ